MNQKALIHFDWIYKDKYFDFAFQPGQTFDDLYGSLDVLKQKLDELKQKEVDRLTQEAEESAAVQPEQQPG